MGISMSGMGMSSLGLTASAMGRADEDERRRRLESIISTLRAKPGRVTQDGIVDLCKKEGLEVMIDPGKDGVVQLSLLIGTEAMCEILVKGGEVVADSAKLEVNNDRHDYAASGSRILADSLRPLPGMTKINLTLDRFSHNLDKLLRMDKLSAPENGGVSCYQAIFGVYTSLRKLFEHEKKIALAMMDTSALGAGTKAEREVLCKKSGRPRINAGSCLGLSLEYWMDRRHIIPQRRRLSQSSKGKDRMDVDSEATDDYAEDNDTDTNKIYSLTIECESSPSSMYSPIRISNSWIGDAIEKAPDATDSDLNNILLNRPIIDWLEPPSTYLPSSAPEGDHDAMNLDNAPGRLPNIRFIAKFNPPVVVPLSVFVNIQGTLGLEVRPGDIMATTFVGLALRPGETDPGIAGTSNHTTQEIQVENPILVLNKQGKEEQRLHSTTLYVPRTEFSRTIESLPFSHPRQLVEILPMLRQYAFTSSLLQHTFGTTSPASEKKTPISPLSPPPTPQKDAPPKVQLDVTLSSYAPPSPRLRVDVPRPPTTPSHMPPLPSSPTDLLAALLTNSSSSRGPKQPINVSVDVHPNAELMITEQNLVPSAGEDSKDGVVTMGGEEGQGGVDKVKRIARALDVCADLGVWGEWLRREADQAA